MSIYRRIARVLAPPIAKTVATPNQITMLRLVLFIPLSALFYSFGEYIYTLIALIPYNLFWVFDYIDGEVAHLKSMKTQLGKKLDTAADMIGTPIVVLGVILGISKQVQSIWIWLTGFIALLTILMKDYFLSKNVDIRIKEYFDLKFIGKKTSKSNLIGKLLFSPEYIIMLGTFLNSLSIALLAIIILVNLRLLQLKYFKDNRKMT